MLIIATEIDYYYYFYHWPAITAATCTKYMRYKYMHI